MIMIIKKIGLENKVGIKIMIDRWWRDNDKKYIYMKGVLLVL